jgi:hypothetical protein
LILYDANLKVKIGQEKYNALQDLAKNKSYKWSREELCEIIKKYKK